MLFTGKKWQHTGIIKHKYAKKTTLLFLLFSTAATKAQCLGAAEAADIS